jgi:hypothetical protein
LSFLLLSCPPADRLLAETIAEATKQNKKIFALSFHVDYWNRLGWKDPFSSKLFSERQSEYVTALNMDGPYTPQMIVNGQTAFVGSHKAELNRNVALALNTKALVKFSSFVSFISDEETLKINYILEGNYKESSINFALVTLQETTQVKNGENGGRTLTNDNIVVQLKTENIKNNGEGETTVLIPKGIKKSNLAIVAFVQQNRGYKIVGAVMQTAMKLIN